MSDKQSWFESNKHRKTQELSTWKNATETDYIRSIHVAVCSSVQSELFPFSLSISIFLLSNSSKKIIHNHLFFSSIYFLLSIITKKKVILKHEKIYLRNFSSSEDVYKTCWQVRTKTNSSFFVVYYYSICVYLKTRGCCLLAYICTACTTINNQFFFIIAQQKYTKENNITNY
jgi:hypothetical protein